jgi:3-hydroxyacyl-CoA dehydrogenase
MAISKDPSNLSTIPDKSKKIDEFIKKGGSPTVKAIKENQISNTKSIKLIMTTDEMETIKMLRDKRPSRNRKITISVHDWVIEAIQEKIEKEKKLYNLDV